MATFNLQDGFVSLNDLWKTDRATALALYQDFDAKIRQIYSTSELPYPLEKMVARFDRQNNVNGMGENPTSVWTSVIVRVVNGKIVEGRLSELYPQGTSVPTYDYAANGKISKELDVADLQAAKDPSNKTNMQGVATAYEGRTWQDLVAKQFLGQAMEVSPGAPTPEGFARLPIHFMSPPQDKANKHKKLDLCWRNADGSNSLTAEAYDTIDKHIFGFYKICANEREDVGTDLTAAVLNDAHYQSARDQIIDLGLRARASRRPAKTRNPGYPNNRLR